MVNILFAYPLKEGFTPNEMYKAFKKLKQVNIDALFDRDNFKINNNFLYKILSKLKLPTDFLELNKKLLNYDFSNIDILFTVKGNTIKPLTLRYIKTRYPHLKIISWSQDDMYAWHNRSLYYTFGLKYYDLVVTQKSYNVDELKRLGAKNVLFQNKAYSVDMHKKIRNTGRYNIDVLFIGHFERERYEDMLFLANNGISVDIFGSGWSDYVGMHPNLIVRNQRLVGIEYSEALSSAKINLCFLRKINRDLQTSRSIEIPACGGFMMAERTNEHINLFLEDEEAVYFDSKEDLLNKVKFYLINDEKRKHIALAGYERTRSSGYSYDDRAIEIIRYINES